MSNVVEVNGTRLCYEVDGPGDAPALVFVHGFSLDTRMWDRQVEAFAGRYRVVRYDLRGFGRSAIPEAGVHYQHHDDLRALLDTLGIERAVVVGLSLGGAVALDFVLRQPERVRALVLVGAVVPGFDAPGLHALSRDVWTAGRTSGADAAKALWIECGLFEVANERATSRVALRRMVSDYSGWGWTDSDPGTWAEPNCAAQLDRISVPSLVVVGERDLPDMLQAANALASGIHGAREVVLPGLGHLPNMEDPPAFNRVVLDFLDSLA